MDLAQPIETWVAVDALDVAFDLLRAQFRLAPARPHGRRYDPAGRSCAEGDVDGWLAQQAPGN
ncbi:hypothetical protein [Salipiger aestuarii]|uniref:hypothetical protein n=1 Tax=Salipiger aestuarii TaxID=568098 RepID=UPI0011B93DB5|nr:hypothetical protein [Salipiger aestuarii]KAB2541779.1 hypothetical protein AL035_10825 [Salipiger aestuarii]